MVYKRVFDLLRYNQHLYPAVSAVADRLDLCATRHPAGGARAGLPRAGMDRQKGKICQALSSFVR